MKVTKRLFINTSFQLAGRLISAGIFFLVTLILARALAPELFGEYFKVMAFLTGGLVLVDFGLNPVYLHMHSEKKMTGYFLLIATRFIWACGLYAGVSTLLFISSRVGTMPTDSYFLDGVFIGGGSLIFGAVTLSITAAFQSAKRWDLVAGAQVLGTLTTLIGVWASTLFYINSQTWLFKGSMVAYTLGSFVTAIVSLVFFVYTERAFSFPKIDWKIITPMIRKAMPLGLMMVVNGFYLRNGVLALSVSRSSTEVGEYGLAYKFFELALVLPSYLMNSYYPDLLEKKRSITIQELKEMFKTLATLSLIVVFFLWNGAPFLVLVRSEFISAVSLLKFFSLIIPLFFLSAPLVWLYILKNQQKKLLFIYVGSFLFNLCVTRVLVPLYGAPGAIVAIGASELLILLCGGVVYYKKYGKK